MLVNDKLRDRIAERAYEIYLLRGEEQGREIEHWLEAEREVLSFFTDSAASGEIIAAADEITGVKKAPRKKSPAKKTLTKSATTTRKKKTE